MSDEPNTSADATLSEEELLAIAGGIRLTPRQNLTHDEKHQAMVDQFAAKGLNVTLEMVKDINTLGDIARNPDKYRA